MARKSRTNVELKPSSNKKIWYVGLYVRLSKEDAKSYEQDNKREYNPSESIDNQLKMLYKHFDSFDDGDEYNIVKVYIDDGISGTTDEERDDFQNLLSDIDNNIINCVAVKDLARSFRNYADQGYYLDDWFPRHNTRFISLSLPPLDSYKEPRMMRSMTVPIQGVINENHCAETSEKVRAVFDMKRRNGEHIGSFAPYGYIKDPENKNAIIIDEVAAEVVRDIYTMFIEGMSKNGIVRHLNDHDILCPSVYKRNTLGLKYRNPHADKVGEPLWCSATVNAILKNRMYCGDMVQGRYRIKSYKVHIQERVPEDEWYIVENTHEAIVSRDVFMKVQSLLLRDTRTSPKKSKLYLFSGFMRCADCGKSMTRSKVKNIVYYYCHTYKSQSKKACTKHTIKHNALEEAVLYAIQQQIYQAITLSEIIPTVNQAPIKKSESSKLNTLIASKEKELNRLMTYKQSLYQDWKDGDITQNEYKYMKQDYESKADNLAGVIEKLKAEKLTLEEEVITENPFIKTFCQYGNIDKLTRDILVELVEYIKVFEDGNITVKFKFSDELERIMRLVENNTQSLAG